MSSTDTPTLPLFYREPEPLSSNQHAGWRLKEGDFAFAARTAFIPVMAGEFAMASRSYPIVIAAGQSTPLALTGLDDQNLFVADGQWAKDAYLPAYVRRYPFGLTPVQGGDTFALVLDAGADTVVRSGDEGRPLFEDGKPTDLTRQALAFCDAFQAEYQDTRAFVEALRTRELLIDRRVDATLPDGQRFGVEGFQIIDAEKLRALGDATVVEWHRKGWLALANFHLASLERLTALLDQRADLSKTAEA